MRLRILSPSAGIVDGVSLDQLRVGDVYELSIPVACVLVVERWAELVIDDTAVAFVRPPRKIGSSESLVLVVDDDPEVRRLTESLLVAQGYHVMVAVHGRDGMQCLRDQCPDLIMLDLNMPVMNGWEFRIQQRALTDARRAAVPVLLMTGEDHAASHAHTLRAAGVITKPFDPDHLLTAVSAAIGSRRSRPDRVGA